MLTFNKPYMTGKELWYISQAHNNKQLSGDGPFTKKCHAFLEKKLNCLKVLLTHSCTAALEMAAKTKAIVVVHYAGLACDMDRILEIANKHQLYVVEDAAQALGSYYKGKSLGTIGDLGTLSFHETKNIISGEGGALLINNPKFKERAEIIREKGTNRSQFFRGQVDKYTWVDIGSSYLPGEVIAAFLLAQLEEIDLILEKRKYIWNLYHKALEALEEKGFLKRPVHGIDNQNAHIYYIILNSEAERDSLMSSLKEKGIISVFHYVPLHSSPAGKKYGRIGSKMEVTDRISSCLLRLPLFVEITEEEVERVVEGIR